MNNSDLYKQAQLGITELKSAIFELLERSKTGLTNADIGRSLGIYMGHEGHEGHISRTLLALMEREGAILQRGERGPWVINVSRSSD